MLTPRLTGYVDLKKFLFYIMILFLGWFIGQGCSPEAPVVHDTEVKATLMVVDGSGLYGQGSLRADAPVYHAEVRLQSKDYQGIDYVFYTDRSGKVEITGVVASLYEIKVRYELNSAMTLAGALEKPIQKISEQVDTVRLMPLESAPLAIHEIYYCGPPNTINYVYDQYVELHNRSDSTIFLDGMIVGRCSTMESFIPVMDSVNYVRTIYAYRFPGSPGGHEYPVSPGEYRVIATDAFNHSLVVPAAVNLENADFEFYNQYANDDDNGGVPNLLNLISTRGNDFYLNTISGAVVLADGTQWDVVTITTPAGEKDYLHLPLETIIDGVEYKISTATSKWLTRRVDAGYTGVGITTYSGKSVQRINHRDSNDSSVDFQILDAPTPGG